MNELIDGLVFDDRRLVIVDIITPERDGISLCKLIKLIRLKQLGIT